HERQPQLRLLQGIALGRDPRLRQRRRLRDVGRPQIPLRLRRHRERQGRPATASPSGGTCPPSPPAAPAAGQSRNEGEKAMNLVDVLQQSPLPKELAFAESEYAERVRKVQTRMVEGGIDILLVSSTPNLGYLTGYDSTVSCGYTIGILGTSGEVELHCSELEAPCALLFSTIRKISVFYWYEAQDTATELAHILIDRGADGKRIGLEMGNAETFASGAFDT